MTAFYGPTKAVNITTKTTTLVKAGKGLLRRIIINKAGSSDTLAYYDGLDSSGTLLGTITSPGQAAFNVNINVNTGIAIVTGGSTAGDYTIVYE